MIGLDTNVVLRFLVQDDPLQSAQASALFATLTTDSPGYLSREVLVELVWVLERAYDQPRREIAAALDGLLAAREIVIESPDCVGLAVERYRQGGPVFSDQMIALSARDAGCQMVYTFDRKAAAQAGMQLVPPMGQG